jgi:hypothetical protein
MIELSDSKDEGRLCASFVLFVTLWWIQFCFSAAKQTKYNHKVTKDTKNSQRNAQKYLKKKKG